MSLLDLVGLGYIALVLAIAAALFVWNRITLSRKKREKADDLTTFPL